MDGSGVLRRTTATTIASAVFACLAIALSSAAAATAQSAGDRQYADPLAGGGQEPQRSRPQDDGASDGGQSPTPAPVPTPDPVAPAPSGSGTAASGDASSAVAPTAETLPRTGAEPVPILATGLLLLLGGVLLRVRTLRGVAS